MAELNTTSSFDQHKFMCILNIYTQHMLLSHPFLSLETILKTWTTKKQTVLIRHPKSSSPSRWTFPRFSHWPRRLPPSPFEVNLASPGRKHCWVWMMVISFTMGCPPPLSWASCFPPCLILQSFFCWSFEKFPESLVVASYFTLLNHPIVFPVSLLRGASHLESAWLVSPSVSPLSSFALVMKWLVTPLTSHFSGVTLQATTSDTPHPLLEAMSQRTSQPAPHLPTSEKTWSKSETTSNIAQPVKIYKPSFNKKEKNVQFDFGVIFLRFVFWVLYVAISFQGGDYWQPTIQKHLMKHLVLFYVRVSH